MKKVKQLMYIIVLIFFWESAHSQKKEVLIKPYSVETTYEKLKKNYPFISPIIHLTSKQIEYKEDVVYKKIGKTKLKLDLYIPKNKDSKTYPTVLLIHGGGWNTGSKENERVMAQHLALNGYVTASLAYRLGPEAPYPAAILDLKDAMRWLRKNAKKYYINPDKIAVFGASAGAHLATLIGTTPNSTIYGFDSSVSDEVQAIVNVDGIVSFIHPEASSEGKSAGIWLNGSREENPKNWKEASPLEYVNEKTPPIIFINSAQPRFHAGRDDMIEILNRYNIYNEIHTIPDSPHSFWLMHPWFETTLNYTISFLDKVLKDED